MTTFQKPENALKRAEELIEVGKKQDALDTLHAAINHRKFRNLWTTTIEKIMIRHLELCVELKKMRTAREGLYQYRTICQAANISSLETVVKKFSAAAEMKVKEAREAREAGEAGEAVGDDLDEMEAPQMILLKAIQAQDTRQQSQDKDTHAHFRFLWETYKVVLDVLKTNSRLEEVYHETAKNAFKFCCDNQRQQEFKRLCDALRKNYQELSKNTGKPPSHQVNPGNPDTIAKTLDTRSQQLKIATQLDLWQEAYKTATEMFELMSKTRPKPSLRSMYYEQLGQIFWKSENHLFHALACNKNLGFVKQTKKNIGQDELQLLASKAVLSTLCVPFEKSFDVHTTLEFTTEGASSPYEKAKKHALLFNSQSVPTREYLAQQLTEKGGLAKSTTACQKLFALIESDFTPLSLCQDAKPFLDEIGSEDMCEGQLTQYITPLKQIIFFRLMKQLSEVYSNMTIENFERAASIVPFSIAEKWMANAARQHGINIQINYSHKAIVFGAPRKVDMKSMRQPLIEIGRILQQAMLRVAPEEQFKKDKTYKAQMSEGYVLKIEDESKQIRLRKEEIERRKEEAEKRKEQQDKEEAEKQRKKDAQEAAQERARQEEERKAREVRQLEEKKRQEVLEKNKQMLEQMKKDAADKGDKVKGLPKVAGKKITDIQADDLVDVDSGTIEKAREAQIQRERQEKIRQRKLESKRVDHLARALREEQNKMLDKWSDDAYDADQKTVNQLEEKNQEDQKKKHQEGLDEKHALEAYKNLQQDWADSILEERDAEYRKMNQERLKRAYNKIVSDKIKRAKDRMRQWEEEERTKEENQRREEDKERRRQQAEEERRIREQEEEEERERKREQEERDAEEREARRAQRAKEREEQDEMRKRAEEKRQQREKEIEERQRQSANTRDDDRDNRRPERRDAPRGGGGGDDWRSAPRGGGGRDDRDDRDRPRGGGGRDDRDDRDRPRDDDDGWRRSGPRGGGGRDGPRGGGGRDDDGGGDWRSGPRGVGGGRDDRGPRRDDRWGRDDDDRGPRRGGDEDRGPRRGGDEDRGPIRRGGDDRRGGRNDDDGDTWRRGGDDEGKTREPMPWKRPAQGARPSRADEDDGGGWRREGDARRSSAGGRDGDAAERPKPPWSRQDRTEQRGGDDAEERPPPRVATRPPPREAPAPEPAPAPKAEEAGEEEDDGFQTVQGGKKKKGGASAHPWSKAGKK